MGYLVKCPCTLQSIVISQRSEKLGSHRFLYSSIDAFPQVSNACILRTASLENSVTQEYSLVLGELESVPSTSIGFPCKLGDGERSVKGDSQQ